MRVAAMLSVFVFVGLWAQADLSARTKARHLLTTVSQCIAKVQVRGKRIACKACVRQGRTFNYRPGARTGICLGAAPTKARHLLTTVPQCIAKVRVKGKRAACKTCVKRGRTFNYRPGARTGICLP